MSWSTAKHAYKVSHNRHFIVHTAHFYLFHGFSIHQQETQVQSSGWENPLEKGMATHSSILTWRIPWTEEPGGPRSHKETDMTDLLTLLQLTVSKLLNKQGVCVRRQWMGN